MIESRLPYRQCQLLTIKEIEEFIEQNKSNKEDKITSLIETDEYLSIRNYIVEFLIQFKIQTQLICDNNCQQGNTLIQFINYNTDRFIIPVHKKINFSFKNCTINTLDYSESDLPEFNDNSLYNNEIKFLILAKKFQKLQLKDNKIYSLTFMSYDVVEIIICNQIPQNIYMIDQYINNKILDFSQLHKLKVLQLDNLIQDIILPDLLEELNLSSKSQNLMILNKAIFANNIKLKNLKLLGKSFPGDSKIYLLSCCIDYILINDQQYDIYSNDLKTIIVKEYKEIEKVSAVDKILLLNQNIHSISLQSSAQIFLINPNIVQNTTDCLELQILHQNQLSKRNQELIQQNSENTVNTLDLSQFTKLLSYYNQHETNKIFFPIQIHDISLRFEASFQEIQLFQKQKKQRLVLNLSHLTQLQKLSINIFKMEKLILFLDKLQINFQRCQDVQIFIEWPKFDFKLYSSKNFISNITKLEIHGLENIIIDDQVQEIHDFCQFFELRDLYLSNINKIVILPINLQELVITKSSSQEFDLTDYKSLNSLTLASCQVNKLITINNVSINDCSLNYFKGEYVYQQFRCQIMSDINFYEPTIIPESLQLNEISIKTLKLHTINNIYEIHLNGINTIIANNTIIEGTLDFTIFPSLCIISVKYITYSAIKFGLQQRKITIDTVRNTLKYIDFSQCIYAACSVKNCKINIVSITFNRIKFEKCQFKIVKYNQIEKRVNMRKLCQQFNGKARYIVKQNNNSKWRTLIELNEQNPAVKIHKKCYFRTLKALNAGAILINKLEFLYEKIQEGFYE